jgi:hypothetical protein
VVPIHPLSCVLYILGSRDLEPSVLRLFIRVSSDGGGGLSAWGIDIGRADGCVHKRSLDKVRCGQFLHSLGDSSTDTCYPIVSASDTVEVAEMS